jgi:hypothetical protein
MGVVHGWGQPRYCSIRPRTAAGSAISSLPSPASSRHPPTPAAADPQASWAGKVQLEDRIVPDAVVRRVGTMALRHLRERVGVTVTLHNWGSGWLEVSGGGGSVPSPGCRRPPAGPGKRRRRRPALIVWWRRESPNHCPPRTTTPLRCSALGPAARRHGPVTPTACTSRRAAMSPVSISGSISVDAGTVGNVR